MRLDRLKSLTDTLINVENNLKYEYDILENLVELFSDGYCDWNMTNGYMFISPKFKSILGYDHIEIPNNIKSWKSLCYPNDLNCAIIELNKHLNNKTDYFSQVIRFYHKDGHEVKILCKGKIIRFDDSGNPTRMVGVNIIV